MSLKPCIVCGEPSKETRCEEHRPVEAARLRSLKTPHKRATDVSPGRWKRLSRRLRKMQLFCADCGSTWPLQVDHIVPIGVRPEWAFELPNLQVLCGPCNKAKGDIVPEAAVVAQIAAQIARGGTPGKALVPSLAKHHIQLHTGGMS